MEWVIIVESDAPDCLLLSHLTLHETWRKFAGLFIIDFSFKL